MEHTSTPQFIVKQLLNKFYRTPNAKNQNNITKLLTINC